MFVTKYNAIISDFFTFTIVSNIDVFGNKLREKSPIDLTHGFAAFFLALSLSAPAYSLARQQISVGYCEWGNYGGKEKPDCGYYVDLVASIFRLSGYEVTTNIYP